MSIEFTQDEMNILMNGGYAAANPDGTVEIVEAKNVGKFILEKTAKGITVQTESVRFGPAR
jgi:hypothetical protein